MQSIVTIPFPTQSVSETIELSDGNIITGVINTYTAAVVETKFDKSGSITTKLKPVSFTVGAGVVGPGPRLRPRLQSQPQPQPQQEEPKLRPTAQAFVPRKLQEVPRDSRTDFNGKQMVSFWKNAVVSDLRKWAGLTDTIPGLQGRLMIHPDIDNGYSEEEKRRRRVIRARILAPDIRFAGHTVEMLQLIRRVYTIHKTEELLKLCADFLTICGEIQIPDVEAGRLVVNFNNLYEALEEANQIESVIGPLDL